MYKKIDLFIDKLIEGSTPDAPLWNIESIHQGKQPAWNYIDGCMMTSLLELYKQTKDQKYIDFIKEYINYYVFDDGTIRGYDPLNYSTDDICESRILFDLYDITGTEKYSKAIEYTYNQIKKHPRTKGGNFWHKKIYPNQVWLDGLFMALPFYTEYETLRNHKQNYIDILHQFKNVRNLMFDETKKLYYHGYEETKTIFWADPKTGLSKNFWLRAMGWYVVAIVDVMSYMDDEHAQNIFFPNLLKEAIDGILAHQDPETKLFYQVVDQEKRDGNYLESSGSALICYAILKGVRLNALDQSYQQIGIDIFNGICDTYL
ncbi:MAG: glycosyl hydrolase family 88, partial [Tenericutes bacterium HGW-Tenericutes-6]